MMAVVVFDLDDTLYDELTYVRSGFRAVAQFLQRSWNLPAEPCYQRLVMRLAGGRGSIFDDVLQEFGVYSRKNVRQCLSVYRRHQPEICLFPAAEDCLRWLAPFPLYIVTDGNKLVQHNKIIALGLKERVRHCYITHRYGIKNAKPSPYCFWKICEREQVDPGQVIYVADNPRKDFVGIKPLGFKTVRILQGQYKDLVLEERFEARWRIQSLTGLTPEFLQQVLENEP
ncbi:Hypothetical protein LUCI_0722 [Lucifera butyrica]|uniref:Haloacid dehalogenase-like hydrolase n=1 Tax=Lucifera butyrica TaxID=1351585 RepID=A0A498R5I6_9FIRM|nr:HAD family hydrolase [Lucifera butyrica]VBB05512.1 Hypothetical protein LUCI_0722 [Lucifera butyrica]